MCSFVAARLMLNMHTDPLACASADQRRRAARIRRRGGGRATDEEEDNGQGGFALTTVITPAEIGSVYESERGKTVLWPPRERVEERGGEG